MLRTPVAVPERAVLFNSSFLTKLAIDKVGQQHRTPPNCSDTASTVGVKAATLKQGGGNSGLQGCYQIASQRKQSSLVKCRIDHGFEGDFDFGCCTGLAVVGMYSWKS